MRTYARVMIILVLAASIDAVAQVSMEKTVDVGQAISQAVEKEGSSKTTTALPATKDRTASMRATASSIVVYLRKRRLVELSSSLSKDKSLRDEVAGNLMSIYPVSVSGMSREAVSERLLGLPAFERFVYDSLLSSADGTFPESSPFQSSDIPRLANCSPLFQPQSMSKVGTTRAGRGWVGEEPNDLLQLLDQAGCAQCEVIHNGLLQRFPEARVKWFEMMVETRFKIIGEIVATPIK